MSPIKNSPNSYRSLSAWLRNHLIVSSLIILFSSTAPRVFLTWRADPADVVRSLGDPVTYIRPAQNLIRQRAFVRYEKPEVSRTPGYPVLLATVMLVVGEEQLVTGTVVSNDAGLRTVLIIQAFILSFEVVVLYWLARRILPPGTAFVAGLLAAFSPWGAVLAGLPMTEGLYLLLLALIFFTMKVTAEAENQTAVVVGAACTGMLTAAAVLVRPVWPLVLLIAAAFFFLYGPKRKGAWLLLSMTLVFAITPLFLWKARNQRVSQFNGLSDIAGGTAWGMLAMRVTAHVNNQDKWVLYEKAKSEDATWKMSVADADREHWRRVMVVFREHPMLTGYNFLLSSTEHAIHPDPTVLSPAKLNFYGDYWVFALLWGGLLILALFGCLCDDNSVLDSGEINRRWLLTLLAICLLLTLSSGISFGAGSRLRAPLELIVPLLAAAGLVHIILHQIRRAAAARLKARRSPNG
jgi:hypothetical protein